MTDWASAGSTILAPLGGLGAIAWLLILLLKHLQEGREMDQKAMQSNIERLEREVKRLGDSIEVLTLKIEKERDDRLAAEAKAAFFEGTLIRLGHKEEVDKWIQPQRVAAN